MLEYSLSLIHIYGLLLFGLRLCVTLLYLMFY